MGKRTFLMLGLALALVSVTQAQVETLARGDHSPTFSKFSDFKEFTTTTDDLFVIEQASYGQVEVSINAPDVNFVEKKAETIQKFTGVATLVHLRSWRAINQRNYGEYYKESNDRTKVLLLPEKPYNNARWKDLHRRC